jgi:hypothetical protein
MSSRRGSAEAVAPENGKGIHRGMSAQSMTPMPIPRAEFTAMVADPCREKAVPQHRSNIADPKPVATPAKISAARPRKPLAVEAKIARLPRLARKADAISARFDTYSERNLWSVNDAKIRKRLKTMIEMRKMEGAVTGIPAATAATAPAASTAPDAPAPDAPAPAAPAPSRSKGELPKTVFAPNRIVYTHA